MNEARHRELSDYLGQAWDLLDSTATDIDVSCREERLKRR
jgi:hypothetical protein